VATLFKSVKLKQWRNGLLFSRGCAAVLLRRCPALSANNAALSTVSQVMMPALVADAQVASSHPVLQCHNGDVDKIISSFDILTYAKAASVLRMLSLHVGLDCFVQGLR
jgi:aminopeptidase N